MPFRRVKRAAEQLIANAEELIANADDELSSTAKFIRSGVAAGIALIEDLADGFRIDLTIDGVPRKIGVLIDPRESPAAPAETLNDGS